MKPKKYYIPGDPLRKFWLTQTQKLMPFYLAPNRYYHNWHHIEKCLALVNKLDINEDDKEILNVAFVYHDAIYIPGMKNEQLSSEMLREDLSGWWRSEERNLRWNGGTPRSFGQHIEGKLEVGFISALIVLNPDYQALCGTGSHEIEYWEKMKTLFDDVDYSILGSGYGEYRRYVENVKKEYLQWYYEDEFWKGRRVFCESLLKKDRIFKSADTSNIFNNLEKRARENIEDEIAFLHPPE